MKIKVINRHTKFLISMLVLLVAAYSEMAAADRPDLRLGVMPIKSHPYGKSYGVWGQEFSQWLFHYSAADFPLFQPSGHVDCGQGQSGPVWFLYGVGGGVVERSCAIPAGKALFINVNSAFSYAPDYGNTEEEVRQDAANDLTGLTTLEVMIDGVPVDPYNYRASSPEGGFVFTVEEGTVFDEFGVLPAGDYYPAVVDGYYIFLRPLPVGEHTIQWNVEGVQPVHGPYSWNVTWYLTVLDDKE